MTVTLEDEAATVALGAGIARGLKAGDAVLLEGELGAGKTALARAILRALGVAEYVPSPSFTLVQAYETPGLTVRHFDLYRITAASELNELGIDDALADGAVLIEWPERARERMPADALEIHLSARGDNSREAKISGPARWRSIVEGLRA
jgi:tRNA threonylcarbamoyl adenosine modification protein YjeE